ncbi:copper-binding protein [Pseudomonas sp. LMG 31766]|jgi:Cu/Ag efflux protein CusF|uniref:Copper-binding protein n=1 Tax=Pseudomonas chaetocerotis TaxID=2758695 RepID=A0A931CZ02_9PSED|nr:copper-binding protein [Pseudomonas chaetocerotis]MBZ9664781.1 copper-binding protein [Pseudomonas chaetocerotis]
MKKQLMITALAALFSLPLLAADPAPLSQGEVRKVDVAAQKITLRHGPIASVGMPPMTMVFEVEKPELLEGVSAGEKVSFQVQQQGNRYIVTELHVMK